jgi:uncharacterized Rmd1/YagE family protein
MTSFLYQIRSIHVAEKLKLKELRERWPEPLLEFSNYEMVVSCGLDAYLFVYNYGSVVFFNVPEQLQEKTLVMIQECLTSVEGIDQVRASDRFILELQKSGSRSANKVFFDRVVVSELAYEMIKTTCMLLAESTALDYYETLIENLLIQTNSFSKMLRNQGKMLGSAADLMKFIGLCMNTKQEIISNLYIVDSPDETWENPELDKFHQDLKLMFEIGVRYRALDYKIKIIQESVEVIVELLKSKRETLLEITIILLIAFETLISLMKWH